MNLNLNARTQNSSSLKKLSDAELIQSARAAIEMELVATTNVVRHFAEIFDRKTFAVMGYSSMQRFAVEVMGLDKASAQRRVNAMLLAIAVPDVLDKIDNKKLFLQSAADIQTFLNKERGARRPYTRKQKAELVAECAGKSTRRVQRHLASLNPACDFKDSKRFISADRLQISYSTSLETEKKLDRLKDILAHVNPYMSREELIDYIAEIALDNLDPKRKAERLAKRAAKKTMVREAASTETGPISGSLTLIRGESANGTFCGVGFPTTKESGTVAPDWATEASSTSGPAKVLPVEFEIREETVGSYGEIQFAVEFKGWRTMARADSVNGPLKRDMPVSVLRESVAPYGTGADLASLSRTSRCARRPSMRGLAFRRPAEKSASLGF